MLPKCVRYVGLTAAVLVAMHTVGAPTSAVSAAKGRAVTSSADARMAAAMQLGGRAPRTAAAMQLGGRAWISLVLGQARHAGAPTSAAVLARHCSRLSHLLVKLTRHG